MAPFNFTAGFLFRTGRYALLGSLIIVMSKVNCRGYLLCAILLCVCLLPLAPAESQEAGLDSVDRDYASELPRIAPLEPGEALDSFVVQPGFRMELVAAEPLVHDPIAMAFDESGRLFVVEMRGYSEQRDENLGAVRLLEDLDGDGHFDTSSVYADGLAWPTAVACYDGGVFVGVAPDIIYYKDTDGDGRADLQRKVFTGFGLNNVQGLVNTFKWGVDNRIHGAASSSGGVIRRADLPRGEGVSVRGRDFSFDALTLNFRLESGGGQHGMSFDRWGRKFVCSNSDHIQSIVFDDRYVARNPHLAGPGPRVSIAADGPQAKVFRVSPIEPWRIVRTRLRVKGIVGGPIEGGGRPAGYFTGATGITLYRGDAWGSEFLDTAIIGDVGGNLIHRKRIVGSGVALTAFRMDEGGEFVASRDIWFRPVQFCNGPDGALYVADMYREVIEHPDSLPPVIKKHLDLTSGHDRGRIYRIVPENFRQPTLPSFGDLPTEQLVEFLEHPNAWHYETAQRLLYEGRDMAAVKSLKRMALDSHSPVGRIRALYTLQGLGKLDAGELLTSLKDEHAHVRRHSLILAEGLLHQSRPLRQAVLDMVNDPDEYVRYQLAFTVGEMQGKGKLAALTELARRDGGKKWNRLAISSSLKDDEGIFLGRMLDDEGFRRNGDHKPFLRELTRLVAAAGDGEGMAGLLEVLETMWSSDQELSRELLLHFFWASRENGGRGARQFLEGSAVANRLKERLLVAAHQALADTETAEASRTESIQTLAFGRFAEEKDRLLSFLSQNEPLAVQLAALKSLGAFDQLEAAEGIVEAWPRLSPRVRASATEILFSRSSWLNAVLKGVETGRIGGNHLESTRVAFLRRHRNESIRTRAKGIFGENRGGARDGVVEAYRSALEGVGDFEKGRVLFNENCGQCHRLRGEGSAVGPDLSAVKNRGAEAILINILDPNREIHPQYVNYIVETKDGRLVTGIMVSETATSVTLRRANDESDTLLRANIEDIRSSALSIMPEDLEETLTVENVSDIIAHLMSQGN